MNHLAELGPQRHKWWQDWRGECVAIVASGPSTKGIDLNMLRDRIHVIAIKQSVDLCPWAEIVYGCDAPWWQWRKGLPDYHGIKLTYSQTAAANVPGLDYVQIKHEDKILTDEPGIIGSGGNSGFQAVNISVQFGATGILLVGFDAHDRSGVHWYDRNRWPRANNPSQDNFRRWRKAFYTVAPVLSRLGVEVVNASPHSELKCFTYKPADSALKEWGL